MRPRQMCQPLRSARASRRANRSRAWCRRRCSNTLSSTDFTFRTCRGPARSARIRSPRQAGCMAKTDKRRKSTRIPQEIELAVKAAEDKKAVDLVVLDLRKADAFTDF